LILDKNVRHNGAIVNMDSWPSVLAKMSPLLQIGIKKPMTLYRLN